MAFPRMGSAGEWLGSPREDGPVASESDESSEWGAGEVSDSEGGEGRRGRERLGGE
jgi:hypothetical protein